MRAGLPGCSQWRVGWLQGSKGSGYMLVRHSAVFWQGGGPTGVAAGQCTLSPAWNGGPASSPLTRTHATAAPAVLPPCTPRRFQQEGVRKGLSLGGRCLIADEMGLGKTVQVRSASPLLT